MRWLFQKPSNCRDWSSDQVVLPESRFDGDLVEITGIRDCDYRSTTDFTVTHRDQVFDLAQLERLDFFVEPFAGWRGPAHTFLSSDSKMESNWRFRSKSAERWARNSACWED